MKVSPNRRNESGLIINISASLALDFEVTCDIILGTAPTDTVCETRRVGIPEVADSSGNIVQAAVAADTSLTGQAGRRRRRAAATKFTETTGLYR